MFVLPTLTDLSSFWETIKVSTYTTLFERECFDILVEYILQENDLFLLQKSKEQMSNTGNNSGAIWKTVMTTIQNVFDTKQPPFRIVLKRTGSPDAGHLVVV